MKKTYGLANILWPLFVLGIFLIIWEVLVVVLTLPEWLLPKPSLILNTLWETRELLWKHTGFTVLAAGLGFGLGTIIGFLLAIMMETVELFRKIFYPFLILSQTVPIIFLAPLLVIWFGFGLLPKVLVSTLVCFFPVAISLFHGLEEADPGLINLLKGMGATPGQVLRIVKLPGAMPSLFSGLRISATYSIMAAVIGEWLGATYGLGVFMTRASHAFATAKVFAAILIVVLLSLIMLGLVHLAQRQLVPWSQEIKK